MNIKWISILTALIIAGSTTEMMGVSSALLGSWTGTLDLKNPKVSLRLTLNVDEDGEEPVVSLDSPDQGVFKIPMTVDYCEGDSISVAVKPLALGFSGRMKETAEGRELSGVFVQGAISAPLVMKTGKPEIRRPQTPKPPFTYIWKEVTFENPEANVSLTGTLTLPESLSENTPVVLLVSGSGLQNRDEELFGHRPFAVIADYLARIGIASLRYDDRGFGASTGDGEKATTLDFAADAKAGLDYLRKIEKFKTVGVLGHSEGASIAYILAKDSLSGPDFIIGLGTPAISGEEILRSQIAQTVKDPAIIEESLAHIKAAHNPWMDFFLAYDPAEDIKALKCPALAMYGSLDCQVVADLNVPVLKELSPQTDVRVYPGLNHIMQHATDGSVLEYGKIEETISPEVLSDIARFILPFRR